MSIPKVNHGILFLFIFGLAIVSIIFLGKTPFLDAVYLYKDRSKQYIIFKRYDILHNYICSRQNIYDK